MSRADQAGAIKRNPLFSLWPQPLPSPTSGFVDGAREEVCWFLTCLTGSYGCNSPLLKAGSLKKRTPHICEHSDSQALTQIPELDGGQSMQHKVYLVYLLWDRIQS